MSQLVVSRMAGELAHRQTVVPRIRVQGTIDHSPFLLPANLAFGLILFALGYRIKLRQLRTNPLVADAALRRFRHQQTVSA